MPTPSGPVRIAVVGPAYPWRGGIPLLVADLAHRLAAAGHDVRLQTWSRQGPAGLLPAQRHPLASPEAPVYPTATAPLSWRNPLHWWRCGRRVGAESDVVVLVHYTTVQAAALWAIARLARRRARVVLICANVVPHEARIGDRRLTALVAGSADAVLTHTDAERAALAALTGRPVAVAPLPPHLPTGTPHPPPADASPRRRLLFFGKVRHYKGVDVLLRALAGIDDVRLAIVGEIYPGADELAPLIDSLGLTGRVRADLDYLPADQIPDLFATVDALVLPYRSATASQLVALAFWHGVPVIVTRVGNLPDVVTDGVDGLICEPGDVADLERAIRELYEPGRLEKLRAAVRAPDQEAAWRRYLDAVLEQGRAPGPLARRGEG